MSNIRVAVRVRPLSEKEKEDGSKEIVSVKRNTIAIENIKVLGIPEFGDSRSRIKEFTFDHCYDSTQLGRPYSTQAQVFEDLGTEVLKAAYDGFNACVFAYGQTGTGKTHTMMGYQDDPGLIPRICEGLFSHVPDEEASPRITCRVDISYFEIYNERVRDLLQPDQFQQNPKFSLKVRNHPREGPYVEGLSWHRVKNNDEIQSLIDRGNEYRVTAETYIHDRSSRSHAIVTVCFTQARLEQNRPSEIVSKINLVDLAGSERADPSSKPDFRKRLTEGANINRSLVTLGYIIKALAERSLLSWDSDDMGSLQNFNSSGGGESLASNSPSGPNKQRLPFIPYRDSVLTWLLKDSLGGNSKTIMIATITPASQFYNESISTLRYAQRAKNIVNKPRINEDGNVALIRELRREIERLQEMLADAKKPSPSSSQIGDIIYFVPNLRSFQGDDKQGGNFLTLPDSEDSIIAEKLHENEEMAKQLTESWMCKWSSTHDIMKESDLSIRGLRNQASSMGVMIDSQLPYLIGMDDDVLSTGVVIFHLKEGETYVGRDNAEKPQDIVLIGPNILTEHCTIKNNHGEVTLFPNLGSMCSVQGQECIEPTKLTQGDYVVLGGDQVFRFNNPTEAAKLREHRRFLVQILLVNVNLDIQSSSFRDGSQSQGSLNTLSTSHLSFGGLSRASSYSSIGGDDPNCLSPYSQLGRSYPTLELEKKHQSEQERIDLARQELEKLQEEHERAEELRQEKEEQMYVQHEHHKQDLEDQKLHLARLIAENERAREKAEEELTHARDSLAKEKEAFQRELDAERKRLKDLQTQDKRQTVASSGFQTDSPCTTTTSVGDDDFGESDTDEQPTKSKVARQMSVEDQLKELEENEFTRRMSYRETEQSLSIQEEDIEDQYLQTQEQIQAKIKQIKVIEEEYKELDKVHLQEINTQAEKVKELHKKEAQLEVYIQEKEELINVSSGAPTHLRSASSELFLASQTLDIPEDSEHKTSSLQNVQSGLREDLDDLSTPRAVELSDSLESLELETNQMNVENMEDTTTKKSKKDFKISNAARDVTSRLYKPPEPKFKYVPKTKEKEVKPAARTRVTRDRDVDSHSRGSPSRLLRDHSKGNSPSPQRHLGKQHSPSPSRDKGAVGKKGNNKGTNAKSDGTQQGKAGVKSGVKKDPSLPVNVKSRTLSPKTPGGKSPERSNDLSSVSGRLGASGKIRQMASASNLASVPESLSEGNDDTGQEQPDPKPVIKRRNRRGRSDWDDDEFRTHSAPDSQTMADALDKYTAEMNALQIPGRAAVDKVIPSFQTSVSVDESQLSPSHDTEIKSQEQSYDIETESGIDVNSDNKSDSNEAIDTQIYNDDCVILSGNLRTNQPNTSETISDSDIKDEKVTLGKREHTSDVSDTQTGVDQDIVPAKIPKSSEIGELDKSLSCSADSLDVSSDSLEKGGQGKHSKRLTQSLPAYFFDNQKHSSEDSFNDSLEDQNNSIKKSADSKTNEKELNREAPPLEDQQASELSRVNDSNLVSKVTGDQENVLKAEQKSNHLSPSKRKLNLAFSQTVCHDNIDSLQLDKSKMPETITQTLLQDGTILDKLTVSTSVNTESNDETESQNNDFVTESVSDELSKNHSISDQKCDFVALVEGSNLNIQCGTKNEMDLLGQNVNTIDDVDHGDEFNIDGHSIESIKEDINDTESDLTPEDRAEGMDKNREKPNVDNDTSVDESNCVAKSESENNEVVKLESENSLKDCNTVSFESTDDWQPVVEDQNDNTDDLSVVRKYVNEVVAGAQDQICNLQQNANENIQTDNPETKIKHSETKDLESNSVHKTGDIEETWEEKQSGGDIHKSKSPSAKDEQIASNGDIGASANEQTKGAGPEAGDIDQDEEHSKPGLFADSNNNLTSEDLIQDAEPESSMEANLDEEISNIAEFTKRGDMQTTPQTRTIGICTSPDLMNTVEGDEDSNDSMDPNEELQVLQDALDQLPAKPVPPGPQLSTARRAARQRAMIRQKQRAGDSDGIGHLSDESPGKGHQNSQARPDSGSRRRKRPSANKNSRVNTDQTSDDYDSSENDSTYSNDSIDNIRSFPSQNGFAQVDIHDPSSDNLFLNELSDIDGAINNNVGRDMSSRQLRRRHDPSSPRSQQNAESAESQSADGSSRSVGVQTFGRHNRGFSSSSLRTDVSDPENSFTAGDFGGMVMSPVSVWNSNEGQNRDTNSSSSSGIIRTLSDFEKSLSQTQRSNASFVSQGSNLERGPTEVWSSSTSDLRPVPVFQEDLSYVMETELMSPGASSLDYADQLPYHQPLIMSSTHEDEGNVKRPDCSTPRSGRNVNISFPEHQVQQVANIDSNTPVKFEVTIHEDNTNVLYNVEKTEYRTYALRNQETNREPGIIPESIHVNLTENVLSKTQEKFEVVKTENVNLSKNSVPDSSNNDFVTEKSFKASYSSEHAMDSEKEHKSQQNTYRLEESEESKNYILPAYAREQPHGGQNQLQASGVIGATSYNSQRPDEGPDACKPVEEQLDVSDCTSDYGTITSIDGRKGLVSFTDSEDDSLLAGSPPTSPHLSIASGTHSVHIVPPTEVTVDAPKQVDTISPDRYSVCSTENIEHPPVAVVSKIDLTIPSEARSQLYNVRHGNIDGDDYFEQAEEIYDDLRQKIGDSSSDDDATTKDDQNDSKEDVEEDSSSLSTVKQNGTIASQETLADNEEENIEKQPSQIDTIADGLIVENAIKPTTENASDDKISESISSKRNHKPSFSSNDDSFLSLEHSETSSNASDYRTPVQSPTDFDINEDIPNQVEEVVIPDTVSSNMALCKTPRVENSDPFQECNPVTTSSPKRPTNVRTVSVNTDTSSSPISTTGSSTFKPVLNSNDDPDRIEEFRKQLERKIAKIQHQHRSLSDSAISSDFTDGDSASLSPRSSRHYEFDKLLTRDQTLRLFPPEIQSSLISTAHNSGGAAIENAPLNDSGNVFDQEQDGNRDNTSYSKICDMEKKPESVQDRQAVQNILRFPESIVDATLAIKPFPVKRSLSLDSISTRVNTGTEHSRALREPYREVRDKNILLDVNTSSNTPLIDDTANLLPPGNSLNNHTNLNAGNKENISTEFCPSINTKSVSCTNLKDDSKREYHRSLSDGNIEDFDNSHDTSADSNDSITFIFVGKDELDDGNSVNQKDPYDPCGSAGASDSESQSPELGQYSADKSEEKVINISGRGFDSSSSLENNESVKSRSVSHGSIDLSPADDGNEDPSSSHSASEEIEDIIKGNQAKRLMLNKTNSRDESRGRSSNNESESVMEYRQRVMLNEDTSPLRHRFGIDEKILPISERSVSADNIPKLLTGYKAIQKSRSTGMLDVGVVAEPESESDIFPPRPISYDEDRTDPSFSLRTMSDGGLDQISQRTVSEIGASLSNKSSSGLEASTSNSLSSARVRSVCSVASSSSEESYEEIVISYSNREGSKRKRLKQGPDSTSSEGEIDIKTLEDRQAQIKHVLDTVEKFICPKPQLVDRGVSTENPDAPSFVSIGMQTSLTNINEAVGSQVASDLIQESVLPALASPFRAQSMDSFGLGAGAQQLQLSDGAISWVKMSELMVETTDLLRKINARLPEMERNASLSSTEDGQAILKQWQEISLQADRSLSNVHTTGLNSNDGEQSLNTGLPENHNISNTVNEYTQVEAQFRIDLLDQSDIVTSEILSEPPESNSCEVSIQTDFEEQYPALRGTPCVDHVVQKEYFSQESSTLQNSHVPISYQFVNNDSSDNYEPEQRNPREDNDNAQSTQRKPDGLFIAQIKTDLGLHKKDNTNSYGDEDKGCLPEDKSMQTEAPVLQDIMLQNTKEIEELKKEHQKLMENLKRASEKRQNRKDTILSRKKVSDQTKDDNFPSKPQIDGSNESENDKTIFEEITEVSEVGPGIFISPNGSQIDLPVQTQEDFKENDNSNTSVNMRNLNSDELNVHFQDAIKPIQCKDSQVEEHIDEFEEIVEIVEVGPGMFINSDGSNAVLPSKSVAKQAEYRIVNHNEGKTMFDDPANEKRLQPDINDEKISKFTNPNQSDTILVNSEKDRFKEIIEVCEVGPGVFKNKDGSEAILPSNSDRSKYFENQVQPIDKLKQHQNENIEEIIEICEVGPGVLLNSDGKKAVKPQISEKLKLDDKSMADKNALEITGAFENSKILQNTDKEERKVEKEPKQAYSNDKVQSTKNDFSDQSFDSKNESFEFEETVIYEVGPGKFWNEDHSEAVLPSCQKPSSKDYGLEGDEEIKEDPINIKEDMTDDGQINQNVCEFLESNITDKNPGNANGQISEDESENSILGDKDQPEVEMKGKNPNELEFPNKDDLDSAFRDLDLPNCKESVSNKDDVYIEITETGRGVYISDYSEEPQSMWIVGPGSYVPQEDGPTETSKVEPANVQPPCDSKYDESKEPTENGEMLGMDKCKPKESKKQSDIPADTKQEIGEKRGNKHEHTWQLKDNEVIAISDVRPVSSSSSSRMRSDSDASLSSIDTATSAEVASVMEGKSRGQIADTKPSSFNGQSTDDEVDEPFTPVNAYLQEEEPPQEDFITPEFHSRNNSSPTQIMKNLPNNETANKKDGEPKLPQTIVRCETSPKLPAKLYGRKPVDSSSPDIFKPIENEDVNENDYPSDTSMNTVNESFTEIIETKQDTDPVLKDGDKTVIFKKSVPVPTKSPEIFKSNNEKELVDTTDYPAVVENVNHEIDTSLDTVDESFTEIIEKKHENTPPFEAILVDSKSVGPSGFRPKETNDAQTSQQQKAPRFGRSDDATQVSMEFSDDFTQTDDGTITSETESHLQPRIVAPLRSGVRPQRTDSGQSKNGSERLKEDLEKLQKERLHILDLLGMNYLPTSLTVELLEAKLNYCIGQTDLLLESVEEEFTSTTDSTRPYTREQQRAVDYISKYRADLKKSKQDIQECREKLNHRKPAGIGRGRTHVRKRDVFNKERQAFIDAFKLERLREQQDYELSRHGTPVRGNTPLKGNTPLMGNSPVVTPRSEASRSSSPTYIPGYMTPREHKDHLVDLRRQLIRDIAEEECYHRSVSPRSTQSQHTSPTSHHRYRSSPDTHHRYSSSPDTHHSYSPKVSVSLTDYPERSHPVCNTYIVAPGTHSLTAVPRSVSLDGIRPHTYHSSPSPPRHHNVNHPNRHLSPPSAYDTNMTVGTVYTPQETAQIYREIEELKKRSPNMSAPLEEMLRRSSFSSTGSHRSSSSRAEVGLSPRTQSDPRLVRPRHHSPEYQRDPRLLHPAHHSPETQRYDNPLSLNLDSLQDDTQGPYSPYSAYAREHIIPNERSSGGVLRGSYQLYDDRSDTSSNVSYGSDTHSDSGQYHGLDEDTVKRLRPVRSSDIKARIGRHKR